MGSLIASLSLSDWLTETPFADLTDVTLAYEDTNPILTDDANRTFQSNMWQCKWHNLVANFGTKQCKERHLMTKFRNNVQQIRKCKFKQNTIWSDLKKYCKSEIDCIWVGELTQVIKSISWVRSSYPEKSHSLFNRCDFGWTFDRFAY